MYPRPREITHIRATYMFCTIHSRETLQNLRHIHERAMQGYKHMGPTYAHTSMEMLKSGPVGPSYVRIRPREALYLYSKTSELSLMCFFRHEWTLRIRLSHTLRNIHYFPQP